MSRVRNSLKKADEWITNALIGTGYGITNQMEGLYQMAAHPVQTAQGIGQMVSRPREIPGMVANALVDTAKRATSGPLGFGEVLGENLSPSMFRRNPLARNELITYHGSPHRINNVDEANPVGKFDLSKVGTGEGSQAYGYGVYLAESPDVAKQYQQNLSRAYSGKTVAQIDAEIADAQATMQGPMRASRLRELESQRKMAEQATRSADGHFYTVDLPDEHIANMLDWDAPLSEQPEILEKLRKAGLVNGDMVQGLEMARGSINEISGQQVVDDLATQWGNDYGMDSLLSVEAANGREAASKYLRSLGIPGIKYFDGGSRAAGEGTRNFVIFDPDTAKILKRE